MKKLILMLCAMLVAGSLAACGGGQAASDIPEEPVSREQSLLPEEISPENPSEEEPSEEEEPPEEPSVQASSQAAQQPEPAVQQEPVDPYPNAPLVVTVVDTAGNPVANVSAVLEMGLATADSEPPGIGLTGGGEGQYYTGADGKLYFAEPSMQLPEQGTLRLRAVHDGSLQQAVPMDFTSAQREVTVVWTGAAPPSQAPDPELRRITFLIVDESGKPVPYVHGGLVQTEENAESYRFMRGGHDDVATDETGRLYVELERGWEQRVKSREYTLQLTGHYDSTLRQEQTVELPDPPDFITVTWKQPLPPSERPPQATGIRLFVVDTEGNPVEGVELGGSPYPKETTGEIPDIAMILGPSDAGGYIRWDDPEPGTYDLYGNKGDKSQAFEVKMPKGKTMVDITMVWNPV